MASMQTRAIPMAPRELFVPTAKELLKKDIVFDALSLRHGPLRRIMFLTPPGSVDMNYGRLAAAATELPWLGMAYIAAAARAVGHDVRVVDYEAVRRGWDAVASDIKSFAPDVVAMALFINNVDRCLRVGEVAKRVDPRIQVVLGGPQATIFPDQTIVQPEVDAIVISEAEISFCRLLAAMGDDEAMAEVAGIWFKSRAGEVIKNPRQPLIDPLDTIPAPALDLYPMDRYYPAIHIWGKRVANYVSSRGCPYECTFCEAKMTFGRTFRFHSPERVVTDLNDLHARYGFDSFQFYDDIFTTNRKRVLELCAKLGDNRRLYKWMCFTRTDLVDPELCRAMKDAGCYLVVFGCESGDQEVLDSIKKKLTVEENYEGIRIANAAGLRTLSSFMLGLPTESVEASKRTVSFALKSKLDYAVFPIFEPYPGTEIWEPALQHGHFIDVGEHQNQLLTGFDKIWVPNGRTRAELETTAHEAFRKFYLRPRVVWTWLRNSLHMPVGRFARFVWSGFHYFFFSTLVKDMLRYKGRGSRYS